MRDMTVGFAAMLVFAVMPVAEATHTATNTLGTTTGHSINTDSAIPMKRGEWGVGLRVENIEFDSLSDEELSHLREADADADLHSLDSMITSTLNASYGLHENLTIGLSLPYVSRDDIREPEHGHDGEEEGTGHAGEEGAGHAEEEGEIEQLGDSKGIGDLSVYGLWRFNGSTDAQSHSALLFGVKTPTGETGERADNGEKFETELQPGTGSWDPFLGLAFSRGAGKWNFDVNVLYTLTTEGSQDTELGDIFNYNVGTGYSLPLGKTPTTWNLVLELNGEWRDKLDARGDIDKNSGGHWLYLAPGISVGGDSWSVFGGLSLPIIDEPNGDQDEQDYRLSFGVQFMY